VAVSFSRAGVESVCPIDEAGTASTIADVLPDPPSNRAIGIL
jgi:hypothetical protein